MILATLRLIAARTTEPIPEVNRSAYTHAGLRAGERDAIEGALRELLPGVRGLLFRLVGPRGDLDDVVQDALIEIAAALPRWEGRAALSTFAHRITVRVAYRCFRKRRFDTPLDLVREPLDAADPESRVSAREALRRLYRCLDKLPAKRRVAFALCAIEGLTPADAAELAGTSAGTMRARLMHARAEVERMLRHDPYLAALLDPYAGGDA